jgi:hemerythrin-like domain-containing protein
LLRDHIYKEDNVLFKMALMVLTRDDGEELLRGFEEIEKKMGAGVHEQLIKSLDNIENILR